MEVTMRAVGLFYNLSVRRMFVLFIVCFCVHVNGSFSFFFLCSIFTDVIKKKKITKKSKKFLRYIYIIHLYISTMERIDFKFLYDDEQEVFSLIKA